MADRPVPVLDLDSLVDRPVVVIDGAEYQLLTLNILPPIDAHRLQRGVRRLDALVAKDELTPEEEAELDALPDRLCRLVLEAPAAVHQKLRASQRMEVLEVFMQTPRVLLATAAVATPAPPSSPTGASSPPDSPASTEATP